MWLYTNKHKIPFQIDEDDFEIISRYSWHINRGRITTNLPVWETVYIDLKPVTVRGQKTTCLHTLLLGKSPIGFNWDHKNRDSKDNRRDNLRLVTEAVNARNRSLHKNNKSGLKGISLHYGSWEVTIGPGSGHSITVGRFKTLEEAIVARREAEDKYWGNNK